MLEQFNFIAIQIHIVYPKVKIKSRKRKIISTKMKNIKN